MHGYSTVDAPFSSFNNPTYTPTEEAQSSRFPDVEMTSSFPSQSPSFTSSAITPTSHVILSPEFSATATTFHSASSTQGANDGQSTSIAATPTPLPDGECVLYNYDHVLMKLQRLISTLVESREVIVSIRCNRGMIDNCDRMFRPCR